MKHPVGARQPPTVAGVIVKSHPWRLLAALLLPAGVIASEMPYGWQVTNGFRSQARVAYTNPPKESKLPPLKSADLPDEGRRVLDDLFVRNSTKALVVARDSEILYERYGLGIGRRSTPLGYSMSKSLTALTVGRALCDGHIGSIEDPLKKYVPALDGTSWGEASVRNVLRMSSGAYRTTMQFNGHKNRELEQSVGPAIAEGKMSADFIDLMRTADERRFEPGRIFNYSNFDTVALGLLVQGATGLPFAEFFEKSVWADAGTESQGAWFVNSRSQTSTYNGFSARPLDWIRIGALVLRELKDQDSCFGKFVKEATTQQIISSGPASAYGYQTWVRCASATDFCFVGFGGQYLLFNLEKNLVIYHHATSLSPVVWSTPQVMAPLLQALEPARRSP